MLNRREWATWQPTKKIPDMGHSLYWNSIPLCRKVNKVKHVETALWMMSSRLVSVMK
jgi:hypothetical protein